MNNNIKNETVMQHTTRIMSNKISDLECNVIKNKITMTHALDLLFSFGNTSKIDPLEVNEVRDLKHGLHDHLIKSDIVPNKHRQYYKKYDYIHAYDGSPAGLVFLPVDVTTFVDLSEELKRVIGLYYSNNTKAIRQDKDIMKDFKPTPKEFNLSGLN